jgi:hypothetical protein
MQGRIIRNRWGHALGLVASALVAALGCGGGGPSASTDQGPPGTFTEIYDTILSTQTESRCNFCHSMPASQVSNGMFHTGNDKAETYAALLGSTSASTACAGRDVVVPGDPEQSLFVLKVSGQPPCGNRMPLGGKALSSAQIQMIKSWVATGANDD